METGRVLFDDAYEYDGPVAEAKQAPKQQAYNTQQLDKSKQQTAAAPGYNAQAGQISGTMLPAYQSILKNPGYSSADKSAITNNTLGGIGSSYGASSAEAGRQVARTNNSAGAVASQDQLARDKGEQVAKSVSGLQENFANTAMSDRDKALAGMGNLFGIDTKTFTELLGGQNPNFSQQPGFWQNLLSTFTGNAGKAAGTLAEA